MASLLIPDIDDALHARLEEAAARRHRTPEEEARELLRAGLARQGSGETGETLVALAHRLFGPENGVDLDIPPRASAPSRPPPGFSGPEWAHLDEPAQGSPGFSPHVGTDPA